MKWTKSETIEDGGKETRTQIIYDSIVSAIHDFMCPSFCEKCVLKEDEVNKMQKCRFEYYTEHEQEVANLIGLKPYEENPVEKSILDYTLREIYDMAKKEYDLNKEDFDNCKFRYFCCEPPQCWVENYEESNKRKLGSSELEYLKQAHRFGYEWISCDDKNGVYLHKKMPTWVMSYNMFQITEGSEKSEFTFTIGQGEFWGISELLEENENVV